MGPLAVPVVVVVRHAGHAADPNVAHCRQVIIGVHSVAHAALGHGSGTISLWGCCAARLVDGSVASAGASTKPQAASASVVAEVVRILDAVLCNRCQVACTVVPWLQGLQLWMIC